MTDKQFTAAHDDYLDPDRHIGEAEDPISFAPNHERPALPDADDPDAAAWWESYRADWAARVGGVL